MIRFGISLLVFMLWSTAGLAQIKSMSGNDKESLFTRKTEERIRDLEQNIRTVSDKSLSREVRDEAVNTTVRYFVDETKVFQVSSVNRPGVSSIPVRKYMNRLIILPYSRVEIEWFETRWVSNFRQAPDGKYFGTVRVYQVFKGYGPEGKLSYTDKTSKDIEVVLEIVDMDLGGNSREVVDVKLGDVRVVETKTN